MILDRNTVFDYKTHRKNFINYLEVIINKDGTIEYAVPSHQQKLLNLYCKNHNITMEKLWNIIPIEESPESWIIFNEGVISVWYDFIIRPEYITEEQKNTLHKLKETGCLFSHYRTLIVIRNEYGNIHTIGESEYYERY